jgi:cyanophycin synthetase
LREHGCSYGEPGGFIRRMTEDEGTWLGHVLEHVAIELQNIAGIKVTFGKTRGAGTEGVYDVVYEYEQRDEGLEAGEFAMRLLHALLPAELRPAAPSPTTGISSERDTFIRFAQRRALGPSTASSCRPPRNAAFRGCASTAQSLIQLGHGKYQQRLQATVTGRTPHIAVELASDKEETNKLLGHLGLPVPKQELVQREEERRARRPPHRVSRRREALQRQPRARIAIHLTDDDAGALGLQVGPGVSRSVIVESFVTGDDHRLLVVDGELVAATRGRRDTWWATASTRSRSWWSIVNADPRRGIGHEKVLTRLELDAQA